MFSFAILCYRSLSYRSIPYIQVFPEMTVEEEAEEDQQNNSKVICKALVQLLTLMI